MAHVIYTMMIAIAIFALEQPRICLAGGHVVLISGGPSEYDALDPEDHDKSWANYVTAPLLASRQLGRNPPQQFWWFVHKPSYDLRWTSDIRATDFRKDHIKAVREKKDADGKYFTSYVDLIESRAKEKNWRLQWINSAAELWAGLRTVKEPIDEVYYWGHAVDDLWLTCYHNPHTHEAEMRRGDPSIVAVADIARNPQLRQLLIDGEPGVSTFWGCNTEAFAKAWNQEYETTAIGYDGKISFQPIPHTGGFPMPVVDKRTGRMAEQKVFYAPLKLKIFEIGF